MTLQTSFRSVPAIQHFVNAAFRDDMDGDEESLQADYVPLLRHRDDTAEQPSIVALPVPRPYGKSLYGPPQVTQTALNESQPPAIAAFRRLAAVAGMHVDGGRAAATRRKIVASDVCLLFRRFLHFGKDITREYVEALEARGIPHLLVGGKTFHEREEVDAIRTALTAIEWPEDELSVYAALHGPLFAIGEEELLEYHSIARAFHPYRVPEGTAGAPAAGRQGADDAPRTARRPQPSAGRRHDRPPDRGDPRARRLHPVARRRAGARQRPAHLGSGAALRARKAGCRSAASSTRCTTPRAAPTHRKRRSSKRAATACG